MKPDNSRQTIQQFFAGIAENTFHVQLGVVDPPLVDYVTSLLMRFVRLDSIQQHRTTRGKPMLQLAEMLDEAQKRQGDARREIHRHIGDFALFWVGLFPESLKRQNSTYHDYCSHGKVSYQIASQIESSKEDAPSNDVLERLSERFELCAYGIQEVRREWERGDSDDGQLRILLN